MRPESGDAFQEKKKQEVLTFDRLYQEYNSEVFSFACYLTGSRAEAEDLFQETWLRVAKNFSRLKPGDHFKAWVFTVLVNLYRDSLRKKRIRRLFFLQTGALSKREGRAIPGSEGIVEAEDSDESSRVGIRMDISQALAKLPHRQREVFVLKEVEGFKQSEISTMLRLPLGTVKTLMYRAVKKLQRELSAYEPEKTF